MLNLIYAFSGLSYLAVFFVSMVGTSTLFLPFPLYALVTFAATGLGLHPLGVGIAAGLGSALGEFTGYLVGLGGRGLMEKKPKLKKFQRFISLVDALFMKYGWAIIMLFAAIPFPFDAIGIIAGFKKYNLKLFFLATSVGKCIKTLLLAYAGLMIFGYV